MARVRIRGTGKRPPPKATPYSRLYELGREQQRKRDREAREGAQRRLNQHSFQPQINNGARSDDFLRVEGAVLEAKGLVLRQGWERKLSRCALLSASALLVLQGSHLTRVPSSLTRSTP